MEAYLYRVAAAKIKQEEAERHMKDLQAKAEHITTTLDSVPGGTNTEAHNAVWDSLADAKTSLMVAYAKCIVAEKEVIAFLARIEPWSQRRLLEWRYVDMMTWAEVNKKDSRNPRYLRRQQAAALETAERLFESPGFWQDWEGYQDCLKNRFRAHPLGR